MTRPCLWCNGYCADTDLDPLLSTDLQWLWEQVATAADRRGDPELTTGTLRLVAAATASERAAAVGLLGGRLRPGQRRIIDLTDLTERVRHRGPALTPGAVAAHATRRRLAVKAMERRAKEEAQARLRQAVEAELATLPAHVVAQVGVEDAWQRISRAGTAGRLLTRPDALTLIAMAGEILRRLPAPGTRVDRRRLLPGDPHALDEGQPLARLVLALADKSRLRPRLAWNSLGVDLDDLTGGLIALGIYPRGWTVPVAAVLTLPPRELQHVDWPSPAMAGEWVFVTENPSVVAAAADSIADLTASGPAARPIRLLCTSGTPSSLEVEAIKGLVEAGWRVAVRADFDPPGLFHVRTLLDACPTATPWRMDADTYRKAVRRREPSDSMSVCARDTPWDPDLGVAMHTTGIPAYEEDLHPELMNDLLTGTPPCDQSPSR